MITIAPTIRTAADLRKRVFPPTSFVVPYLIPEGGTIFAGRPKIGKSWAALEIAAAVATGGKCLGALECEQGNVLYLALEDNERRLQSRLTRLLGADACDWPRSLEYATEWKRADAGGLQDIRTWIAGAAAPRLIVVDVLAMFKSPRRGTESYYEADYAAMKGLQSVASDTGVAVVGITHVRKSGSDAEDPIEKVSGTLGLSGAADTVVILDRTGQGATLQARGRDLEEIDWAVEFDNAACRWKVQGAAAEVRQTDERAAILNVLRVANKPMTPAGLAEETGMPGVNVRQLLLKMVVAGEVLKRGRGLYLHPERFDLLNPDNNDNKVTSS